MIDQSPEPSAVAVPTAPATSEVNATAVPASAVPEMVNTVLLVMSSSEALPLSLAASRSGVLGAAGAVRSTVNSPEVASLPTLPTASVAVTVTSKVPSASAASVSSARLQVPSPLLVAAEVCP